jgi:AmmeMemoRadiSam system protein B/AmmeMemoRadiSam system protein A
MGHIRPAAVAGMFYPDDARELDGMVRGFLREASSGQGARSRAKALIVPHAGLIYSGPIAASAYARLAPVARRIRRVVLIGPCHRVPLRGLAVPSADAFATPLGAVPVDRAACESLLELPCVRLFDATHAQEHALEVQLPFLQTVLRDFAIVPLVAGDATSAEVAQVLERVWGGDETLIVVSSDLSHYLDDAAAKRLDAATCRAIETLDDAAIGDHQACGRVPVRGLLRLARAHGLAATTLDLRTSGDTAGDRRRVVGYGAWLFGEQPRGRETGEDDDAEGEGERFAAASERLLRRHGRTLLGIAAASIDHGLRCGRPLAVELAGFPPELTDKGAAFVTLTLGPHLRGCIGSPEAHRPLVADVSANAFAAAFSDPRFPKLKAEERAGLTISLSVLSPPQPMACASEADLLASIKPGEDGLIIASAGRRALFLPQVWKTLPVPRQFLTQLKLKAGLPAGHWADDFRAWRFVSRSVAATPATTPAAPSTAPPGVGGSATEPRA